MAGYRIPALPKLTPETLAPLDEMLVFDESENVTKSLAVGPAMAGFVAPLGPQGYVLTSNGVTSEWRTSGALGATAQRLEIIATEGQTNFATTAPYVVGYLGVYVNGVRLANAEFTAIDGHNVIIAAPCKAGDVVLLEGFLGSDTGGTDDFLRADLIETTGAGLVGFDPALVYPNNTVGQALAGGYVKKPGDTMTGKLTIKNSAALLALETTSPRGTGRAYMEWFDPSGRKGWLGYGSPTSDLLYLMNEMNAGIVFGTNAAEGMRLNEVGNVGIGTSSPSSRLTVTSAVAPQIRTETTVPRGGGNSAIAFNDPSGPKGMMGYGTSTDVLAISNYLNTDILFQTGGVDRLRVTAAGDIQSLCNEATFGRAAGGTVSLVTGGAGNTGYLSFKNALSARMGYIGFQGFPVGGHIAYNNENGGGHSFTGPIISNSHIRLENSGSNITKADATGSLNIGGGYDLGSGAAFILRGNGQSAEGGMAGGIEFWTQGTSRAVFTGNGAFLYGTRTPFDGVSMLPLQIMYGIAINAVNTGPQTVMSFMNNQGPTIRVGWIGTDGSVTSYVTTSDERVKTNIADAADSGAVIDAIKVREFDFIVTGEHVRFGTVAQELHDIVPEAVWEPTEEEPESFWGVDYSKLVPLLIKEIQSLRARLEAGGL